MAELQDFYDTLALLQEEEKMANMQQGLLDAISSSLGTENQEAYCYTARDCNGVRTRTQNAGVCCTSAGGSSFKIETRPGSNVFGSCDNCSGQRSG